MSHDDYDRLERALAGSAIGVWDWYDIPKDLGWVSESFIRLMGYEPGEFKMGLNAFIESVVHPEDKDRLIQAIQGHFTKKEPFHLELRLKTKSGAYRWFLNLGKAEFDEKGQPLRMTGSLQDISPQKAAEENLKRQESLFRTLIENSSDTFMLFNPDFTIRYVSPSSINVFGYSPDEMIRQGWDCLHPDDCSLMTQGLADLRDLPNGFRTREFRLRQKDGSWRWYEGTGQNLLHEPSVGAIVIHNHDITERKLLSMDLLEHKERLNTIFENAGIGIGLAVSDGTICEANPRFIQLFGYPKEELFKLKVSDILHPEDRESTKRNIQEVFSGDRSSYQTEKRYLKKNGDVFWGSVTAAPVKDIEGKPKYIVGAIEDISVRKEAEQSLAQYRDHLEDLVKERTHDLIKELAERKLAQTESQLLQDQLFQAQKMELVGQLAGGIAHDFNNILTVILGYTHSLIHDPNLKNETYQTALAHIQKSANRAGSLIKQLLAFGRKQILKKGTLHLNQLIKELKKILGRLIGEDIVINLDLDPTLVFIMADSSQIEQIFFNLAVNARDAMPEGGKIKIRTRNVRFDIPSDLPNRDIPTGDYALIEFSDTGTGIKAENLKHIFEPFFTTKEEGKGTGLGLATVFGIVKQHGGHVDVRSTPGEGTLFNIYFPKAPEQRLPPPMEAGPEKAHLTGNETILVVEDEEDLKELTCMMLSFYGYHVLASADAREAIHLIKKSQSKIDLLLTDVIMPEMTGPELVKEISSASPSLKTLYMSGYAEDALKKHGLTESDVLLIQKPFTPETLAKKIREVLDQARTEKSQTPRGEQ